MEKLGFDCNKWELESGEGLIQFMDNGDNIALIVAGTNAIDTRMTTYALVNYEDYDFQGSRVIITGSLSNPIVR